MADTCQDQPEDCFCRVRDEDAVDRNRGLADLAQRTQGLELAMAKGLGPSPDYSPTGIRRSVEPDSVVTFGSGATRSAENTYDPSGFLSPAVLASFSRYMERHRRQIDGGLRASDNWQRGMPTSRAMRSLTRHFMDLWLLSRGYPAESVDCTSQEDALHAIMFNVQVILKNRIDGDHHEVVGVGP